MAQGESAVDRKLDSNSKQGLIMHEEAGNVENLQLDFWE